MVLLAKVILNQLQITIKYHIMEENKKNQFWNKFGFLVLIAGIAVIFFILKLIGFPEFLYN
jgi:hypothetical protein